MKKLLAEDRVGHAYIFDGPKGIGKRTVARIFAGSLLCSSPVDSEACRECMPCRLYDALSNPDISILHTEGPSIGVDDIRKIQEDIIIRPMYSYRKVYLIVDSDKMTVQAQNCLLKTLEEPQEYAVLILTASNFSSLLETIRSRAVRYSFKRNTPDEIKHYLQARYERDSDGFGFISVYSEGCIGTALNLVESGELSIIRDKSFDMILAVNNSRITDVFTAYDFFEANKASIELILDVMVLYYRDLLVAKTAGKENILINSDKKDIIFSNVPRFSEDRLIRNIDAVELTRRNIKQNANSQLSIEVMLMKLQEDNY